MYARTRVRAHVHRYARACVYAYMYGRGIRGKADGMATTSLNFFRDGRDVLLVFPSATFVVAATRVGFVFRGGAPGEIINY